MRKFKLRSFILIFISAIFFLPEYIFPYLDPGTGSYIIQVILAGVLGIGVGIKLFWGKIKLLFVKNKNEEKAD